MILCILSVENIWEKNVKYEKMYYSLLNNFQNSNLNFSDEIYYICTFLLIELVSSVLIYDYKLKLLVLNYISSNCIRHLDQLLHLFELSLFTN